MKALSPDFLRKSPAGVARNGDRFWLCQTESEVRLVREAADAHAPPNTDAVDANGITAVQATPKSFLQLVIRTPERLEAFTEHLEPTNHPGEIKLYLTLSAMVAQLLARKQKAERARVRRENQRRQRELSLMYVVLR